MSEPQGHRQTDCLAISDGALEAAARALRDGRLVAFPTETVYGLGADACNADAVAGIFAAKQRPSFNPLISHVASIEDAFALGRATPFAKRLAAAFWPGPMTLILERQTECPIARLTSAGLDHIALRVPADVTALKLLRSFGGPVAAPSANLSGRISPTRAEHVLEGLTGRIDIVLDGGRCESGVESTVVDCSGGAARILRPGGVTRDDIEASMAGTGFRLDEAPTPDESERPVGPGMLASHYAPEAGVATNVVKPPDGMEFIGFGPIDGSGALRLNLSHDGSLLEAAANLFDMLHAADGTGTPLIGVAPIPETGLGEAINDRLRRAAAPRGS